MPLFFTRGFDFDSAPGLALPLQMSGMKSCADNSIFPRWRVCQKSVLFAEHRIHKLFMRLVGKTRSCKRHIDSENFRSSAWYERRRCEHNAGTLLKKIHFQIQPVIVAIKHATTDTGSKLFKSIRRIRFISIGPQRRAAIQAAIDRVAFWRYSPGSR